MTDGGKDSKRDDAFPRSGVPEGDGRTDGGACPEFRIRDFPDLRRLRKNYLRSDDKPVAVDAVDNPRPDGTEEDFGLEKSTAEEAMEFYRQVTGGDDEGDDALREFLDDGE